MWITVTGLRSGIFISTPTVALDSYTSCKTVEEVQKEIDSANEVAIYHLNREKKSASIEDLLSSLVVYDEPRAELEELLSEIFRMGVEFGLVTKELLR
jgi:hypothetical protein